MGSENFSAAHIFFPMGGHVWLLAKDNAAVRTGKQVVPTSNAAAHVHTDGDWDGRFRFPVFSQPLNQIAMRSPRPRKDSFGNVKVDELEYVHGL